MTANSNDSNDSKTDLIANIKINSTTFELSLKDEFIVLSHAMMDDILFPQTISIFNIIHEHFGDVHIECSYQNPILVSLS